MGGGLVGHDIDRRAAREQLREDVGAVAQQADRQGRTRVARLDGAPQRVVEVGRFDIEIPGRQPALDPRGIDLDADADAARHRHGQRLRAAHAAEPAGQGDRPGQGAAEALLPHRREGLVGPLQDALGADVDPRPRGHLAVHRQPERVQAPELVPVGPVADQVGVGEQHARCPLVRLHHADRLAGLDQQRLVVAQRLQRAHDRVVGGPVARRLAGPAVDDELGRMLGDLGVEVVLQHPQRGFLLPAEAGELGPARGADG